VQEYLSLFNKTALSIICLLCLQACSDIPRDNLLDPKNKNSIRPQIVAVDVFVNTGNDQQYNQYMLSALNQLQLKYQDQITIAEYHRNVSTNPDFDDSLALSDNELLYDAYTAAFTPFLQGVPDVFLNGRAARVQGASSAATAAVRLEEALQLLLLQNSYFTIEVETFGRSGSQADLTVQLARLGSEDAQDILLKAVLTEQIDNQFLKRVVRSIRKSDIIPDLSAGEIKTCEFHLDDLEAGAHYDLHFYVTSDDELNVYQSLEMSLP